ncbi:MAG: fumarylacetoacetate hydrolase family protein [Gammaproteobacteria bacterium]|nr:fumarylacetoacetate hydrolase family protein [Gammaproteobacteria bacterium]
MKLARFDNDRLGLVDDDEIIDVSTALDALPALSWPVPAGDWLIRHLEQLRGPIRKAAQSGARTALAGVTLRSPVANPSKIVAAPVNYRKHLEESRADEGINYGGHVRTIDELGVFLKSSTSLVGAGDGVVLSWTERRIDHELELAVIVGSEGYCIARNDARRHIAGYAIGLDMSIRGTEDRSFRKSLDSFTVLGPWLVSADELADCTDLTLTLSVNGQVRQQSSTAHLIWDVPKLIEYASSAYRLYPGDIILTGTPEGVAPVKPGDVMDCRIAGIGSMSVAIR